MLRQRRHVAHRFLLMALFVSTMLTACTVERPTPQAAAGSEPAAQDASAGPPAEATVAPEDFRVELPVTLTPTQEAANAEGTPLPTHTPAPTSTPRPTKTPWPTKAPTSAPAAEEGMVYVPGGSFAFGADGGAEVPRSFRDYAVSVDRADLPAGVELNALVG